MLDPTSFRGVNHLCLKYTCPPLYSTRPFGSSLASVRWCENNPRMGDLLRSSHVSYQKQNREAMSNPRMGDPLGSSRVSSQKQNHEDVIGAKNGQYRTMVEARGP
ncbi:hypothetical protein DVH24_038119 [Malus domestica]|uniref:Uncharacterized protein n=1 Tax=Malus domestica TaxID=3750 RepID=A0A498KDE3_MALDO|nr:hypothetical protein DVH24_038119 [Malus domestica]